MLCLYNVGRNIWINTAHTYTNLYNYNINLYIVCIRIHKCVYFNVYDVYVYNNQILDNIGSLYKLIYTNIHIMFTSVYNNTHQ